MSYTIYTVMAVRVAVVADPPDLGTTRRARRKSSKTQVCYCYCMKGHNYDECTAVNI